MNIKKTNKQALFESVIKTFNEIYISFYQLISSLFVELFSIKLFIS